MPMKDILDARGRNLNETLSLLEAMVNMDSPSVDKPLVDRFVRFLGPKFEALGASVQYISAERFGDHLVARFNESSSKKGLLILGHTDTVFPAGEVARRPFKVEGNRATGPGAFDMKGGIALIW